MYQLSIGLDTELHAALCSTDVHVLYLSTFREVLHHGSAVEDSGDICGDGIAAYGIEIVGDIAKDDVYPVAEECLVGVGEIIIEQGAQTAFGLLERLSAYQTVDVFGIAVYQFVQDVDTQIASDTGYEHIA